MFRRVVLFAASAAVVAMWHQPLCASDELTFERHVRPILKEHCFHCHGENPEPEGGLDVRLRRFLREGGDSGPAIVSGRPDESLLLERLRRGEMPPVEDPSKKVPPERVELIARWIAAGARTARPEPDQLTDADLITDEEQSFWAFQPVSRPDVPTPQALMQVKSPIDAFVWERLEASGLSMSPAADRVTRIRRVYFDLLGVPPEPDVASRFVDDESTDAWDRLVDRLLASPYYGDRWGRHWLDVAGYSDSEGYTNDDVVREWAWKYRDWVIDSLNGDKPFDAFLREQLAGDEMVRPPYSELAENDVAKLVATGFLRMAPDGTAGGADDLALAKNEVIAETIKIVSTAVIGLSVGCAQCHDHRYDPIPQSDYYRMRAIFEPAYDWANWRTPNDRRISLYTEADKKKAAEIELEAKNLLEKRTKQQNEFIAATFENELAKLPEEIRDDARQARETSPAKRTERQKELLKTFPSLNVTAGSLYLYNSQAAAELQKMADEVTQLRATKPNEEFVRALTEIPDQVPKTFLFYRGDHEQPKQEVEPGGLTVLASRSGASRLPINETGLPTTGRRLAWARRLTDGSHPLVARVLANRVWMHHFGRGLVDTPGDFGVLGDRPTHPELLDWLASELVASGWSLKHLHRLITTSAVYQQTSHGPIGVSSAEAPNRSLNESGLERAASVDPDNALYWRFPIQRLDAETLRDSILTVSGKLNLRRFGPPVPVMADQVGQFVIGKENLNAGRPGAVIPMNGEQFRKSVFIQRRRTRPLTVLDTFDLPQMEPNCTKRNVSTVATQSLMMMNSPFIIEMSEFFADRVRRDAGTKRCEQVRLAWQLAYTRMPTDGETREALAYLDLQTEHFNADPVPAKTDAKSKTTRFRDSAAAALASFCQLLLSSNEFLYID